MMNMEVPAEQELNIMQTLHRKYKEAKADLEENDDEKEGELFDALQKKYVELLMEKVKENSQAAAATKAATATATATATAAG